MESAVALLSGGLDSGVAAAAWAAQGGGLRLCLTFDYGQRAARSEAEAAARLAGRFGAPCRTVRLEWLEQIARQAGSALVDASAELPSGTEQRPGDARSAAAVWVPGRNAVFVAVGAAWAEALGCPVVLTGFNREEADTFPDNSPEFVAAAGRFLASGTRSGVRVESPTLHWDKPEIARQARALGLGPDDFWSCYQDGPEPCHRCESCLRSARAWRSC